MKKLITIIALLLTFHSFSKSNNEEFEGVIHYEKTVTRLSNNKKAIWYEKYALEVLGKSSDFYYKTGHHLWHRFPTEGKELYINKSKNLYIKKNSEYVNWAKHDVSKTNEEITSIKIISEVDTIIGFPCQVLEVKSRMLPLTGGKKMYRKFYFNKESFYINPKYLKSFKMNSQNIIFKLIQCLPLRIYVKNQGVIIDYKATSADFKELDDSLFELPLFN